MSNKKLIEAANYLEEIKEHQMQTAMLARSTEVYKLADKALKALSEAEQEPTPCGFFTMPYNTTSATKCSNCGFEKYQHKEAEQEKPKEDDNPLIANDKYAVTDWQEHTEPMSAEELSPLELQATKFLNETDTMQFSEMELLAMFASKQLAQQKEETLQEIRNRMEKVPPEGSQMKELWNFALQELLTHLKKEI
jgi:hypothetical protein